MAKNNRNLKYSATGESDSQAEEDAGEESQADAATGEQEADSKPEAEAPDLSGLVKMHRDGKTINAHPDIVKHHQGNGWELV